MLVQKGRQLVVRHEKTDGKGICFDFLAFMQPGGARLAHVLEAAGKRISQTEHMPFEEEMPQLVGNPKARRLGPSGRIDEDLSDAADTICQQDPFTAVQHLPADLGDS